MSDDSSRGLAVVRQQISELDALTKQTLQDLNTVAGIERIEKWRVKTVALLTDAVGRQEGQIFSSIQPGPSFTNDMVEEFIELADCYRTPLVTLARRLDQASRPGS